MEYCLAYFDEIYSRGGYYDREVPPAALRRLDHEHPNRVSYLGEVFPSASYKRDGERRILASDKQFLARQSDWFEEIDATRGIAPASIALTIRNCFVHDSVIQLPIGRQLETFYTTYRECDRPYVKPLGRRALAQSPIFRIQPRGRRIFFLGSAGSANYGHWLIDDLPRLQFLRQNREPATLLLQSHPGTDDWRRTMAEFFLRGCDVGIVFIPPGRTVHCRELTYVTPVTFHPNVKNRGALDVVRAQAAGCRPGRARKLFVARTARNGRQIENIDAVAEFVVGRGFSIIEPESLAFEDQLSAFAGADEIVGIMGAGMCNTAFSAPRARITYLAPEGWRESFYWDLANLLDHQYTVVFGARMNRNEAPHLDDFRVDLDDLRSVLAG